MRIKEKHIQEIRAKVASLNSNRDIADLINFVNSISLDKKKDRFRLNAITYYANPKLGEDRYRTFEINKKSGGKRIIHSPHPRLKSILETLNLVFQAMYYPNKHAMGFVPERTIVDNANKHVGKPYVYNIDLKNFFYSFDRNTVKLGFMRAPFNLIGDKEPLAFLLACLCTHPIEIDGETKIVLPQGSPASPILTNILCEKLDRRLGGLAKKFNLTYTRYADDISFSSYYDIFNNPKFINEVNRIIESYHTTKRNNELISNGIQLKINEKKSRIQKRNQRQEVTGLTVNEKVNVSRSYVKQISKWLYLWRRYGREKAIEVFKKEYLAEKGHIKNPESKMERVIAGKLEFLKMVKGVDDSTYQNLNTKFEKLQGIITIENVIKTWETEGIEKAMKKFYKFKPKKNNISQRFSGL